QRGVEANRGSGSARKHHDASDVPRTGISDRRRFRRQNSQGRIPKIAIASPQRTLTAKRSPKLNTPVERGGLSDRVHEVSSRGSIRGRAEATEFDPSQGTGLRVRIQRRELKSYQPQFTEQTSCCRTNPNPASNDSSSYSSASLSAGHSCGRRSTTSATTSLSPAS